MKPRDLQRGIASRHARAAAEGPNLGRVARLRESKNSKVQSSRRRIRTDAIRKKSALIWSAVLSVVVLITLGLAVFFWLKPYLSRAPADLAGVRINPDAQVRIASKFPSPSREKALELVKQALANRDPALLESLFRMGSADRAGILSFLEASEQRDGFLERYEWLSSMDVNGLLLDGVLVVYNNNDKRVERLALLTPDAVGTWKLDFDAFARTVTPSWQELLEKGAEQALVRVFVTPDFYFNGPFDDEEKWDCYGITSPETELVLRGYCAKNSEVAAAMERLFVDDRKMSRATLEIRRVKDGGAHQFEITRLVAEDWVAPDQ